MHVETRGEHEVADSRGGVHVSGREVGARQRSRRLAEACQIIRHGDDRRADRFVHQIGEAEAGDAADLEQRDVTFLALLVRDASLERGDDAVGRLPLHGEDEGKAEAGAIGCIQGLQALVLPGRARGQAGAALFTGRCLGQIAADGGAAGKFRVGTDQGELHGLAGLHHGVAHGGMQRDAAREWPRRGDALRHPG